MLKNFLFTVAIFCPFILFAQSPVNGFMQGKGRGNVVLSYYAETYIRSYLSDETGSQKLTQSKVSSKNVNAFTTFGVSDKVDLQITLGYQKATGDLTQELANSGKTSNFQSGLQDITFYAKYNPYNVKFKHSSLAIIGAAGLLAPFGNYKIGSPLQSTVVIGSRSVQLTGVGLLQYKCDFGLFFSGAAGYSVKSNHIPNASIAELKTGFAASKFYVDGFIAWQGGKAEEINNQTNGANAFAISNVKYTRTGFNVFIPIIKKLGISTGASKYTSGPSKGELGAYGAIIYNF